MGNVILVEKIVELVAVSQTILCKNAQPGKLAVALQPLPAHDKRAHDRLAEAGQLHERLANSICRPLQNFALIRLSSRFRHDPRTHEHCNFTDETTSGQSPQDFLFTAPRLYNL